MNKRIASQMFNAVACWTNVALQVTEDDDDDDDDDNGDDKIYLLYIPL